MVPKELLQYHFDTIRKSIAAICFRHGLTGDGADDFSQEVMEHLIADDYRVLREFSGNSSFRTYIQTVVARLFIDRLRHEKPRWRPSAEASRLGPAAVFLERLIYRDGNTPAEASEIIRISMGYETGEKEIERLLTLLPVRIDRPLSRNVGGETLDDCPGNDASPEELLIGREQECLVDRMMDIVKEEMLHLMTEQDRVVFRLHFQEGIKISEVARMLRTDRALIDRRIKTLLAGFKEAILRNGIKITDAEEAIRARLFENEALMAALSFLIVVLAVQPSKGF